MWNTTVAVSSEYLSCRLRKSTRTAAINCGLDAAQKVRGKEGLLLTAHAVVVKSLAELVADDEEHRFWVRQFLCDGNEDGLA